jgi:hypothetical protein
MDILNFFKKKGIYFRILFVISFVVFLYKSFPTPLSQQQGSDELFYYDKKQSFIGIVKLKYRGDHYVPFIDVNGTSFSVDDITFSKCKIGDSIIKGTNNIYYVIYRNGNFYDSINIMDYYKPSITSLEKTIIEVSK